VRAGGRARVMARLAASTYMSAGGELVWLGPVTAELHPRALLAARAAAPDSDDVSLDVGALVPWRPRAIALDAAAARAAATAWRRLADALPTIGAPAGFGARLLHAQLVSPLHDAPAAADALARACARDDAPAAADAALALLGLGSGLTPSGDDFVGGALFARRALAAGGCVDAHAWRRAAEIVFAAAPARTHPISAALLGDLAAGLAHAPLHDLLGALAAGADGEARTAAGRLVRLGHSSGWDLLAGLAAGLGAPA
jgi:uncharacterized protein DUF2877